jgi:hypothetical protein
MPCFGHGEFNDGSKSNGRYLDAAQGHTVERHYKESEIGKLWHMYCKTVHRIFDGQPGIAEWEDDGHRSRRIPELVMQGVLPRSAP